MLSRGFLHHVELFGFVGLASLAFFVWLWLLGQDRDIWRLKIGDGVHVSGKIPGNDLITCHDHRSISGTVWFCFPIV